MSGQPGRHTERADVLLFLGKVMLGLALSGLIVTLVYLWWTVLS